MNIEEIKELAKEGVKFINPLNEACIKNILPDGSEIIVMCNSKTYDKEMEFVKMKTQEILNKRAIK